MSRYVFDIETNGLLLDAKTMYVLVAHNLDTGEVTHYLEGDLGWKEKFDEASELIGHNIIGYDLAVLKKLFNFVPKAKLIDTLLYSQILNYKRFTNGHSLESWGKALGLSKIEFNDWSQYSEEMLIYCKRDVELNVKVYEILKKEYDLYVSKKPEMATYMEAEHYASQWIADAELNGFPFDYEAALELFERLEQEMNKAYEALDKILGIRVVPTDMVKGFVEIKKPKWTKAGFYDVHTARWFGVDPCSGYPGEERMIEGEYCRVEFKKLSIASSADVKLFLDRHGWVPTEYNFKIDKITGKKVKSSPKITEDSLELLGGHGKLYLDFMSARSRYSILKTWIEKSINGRLHGGAMNIGTPSMRARHNIIVNIPSVDAPWGKEMRSLFTSIPGWKFIGADSAGNQARGLAHYLGDKDFINTLLHDDIHQYNANILTKVLAEMGVEHTVPRSVAKRILYAFLFGASGSKLWSYVFGNLDPKNGNKLKAGFLTAVPGFKALLDRLDKIYGATSKSGDGYIPSIAGNRIYCDSFHKLLVYLLQSTEKITCSTALMLTVKELKEKQIPYQPLIYYHDEIDFMVPEEYAEQAAEIAQRAFKEGPELYGIKIMDGSSKIGLNWLECH